MITPAVVEPDYYTRALAEIDFNIQRAAQAVEIADAKVARRQRKLEETIVGASCCRESLAEALNERRRVEQARDDAGRRAIYADIRAGKEHPGVQTACRSAIENHRGRYHDYCDEELCTCPCHKEGDELL